MNIEESPIQFSAISPLLPAKIAKMRGILMMVLDKIKALEDASWVDLLGIGAGLKGTIGQRPNRTIIQ